MPACHAGDRRFESGRVRHPRISLRPVRPPGRGVLCPGPVSASCPAADPAPLAHPPRDPTPHPHRHRPARRRRRSRPCSPVALGLVGGAATPAASPGRPASAAAARRDAGTTAPTSAARATAEPGPVADRAADPGRAGRVADVADRAGHQLPVDARRARPRRTSPRSWPARARRYDALELVDGEADAILAALGVAAADADASIVAFADDARPSPRDLAKNRKRLAFLRADAVGPEVRALAWGGTALFGVDRVKNLADWPLTARLPAPAAADAYDPATTWTLFAGGDILLDRGVYLTLKSSKGADFPFDGGTRRHHRPLQGLLAAGLGPAVHEADRRTPARSGDLIKSADIAAANFENPAPDKPRFHASGTIFSADPALIDGLADAGIDYVSLANNHIRDAGGGGPPPDDQERHEARHRGLRRGQEPRGGAQAGDPRGRRDEGRDPRLRRDRRRLPRDRDPGRQRGPVRQGGQGGRGRGAQGRGRPRDRLPALGHRIRPDAVRQPAASSPR